MKSEIIDYELSNSSEEEFHDLTKTVYDRESPLYVLTPDFAQKFLVDSNDIPPEMLADDNSCKNGRLPSQIIEDIKTTASVKENLEKTNAESDLGELSDGDFLESDESLNHEADVDVIDGDKDADPLSVQTFVVPQHVKGVLHEMSENLPENVLIRQTKKKTTPPQQAKRESILSRPKNDPAFRKVAAAALACFALASYRTFYPIQRKKPKNLMDA